MDGSPARLASDPRGLSRATTAWAGRRSFATAALALSLLVLVPCAVIVVTRGFDGLYGQDPFAYYGYALGPLREAVLAARIPPAFPWTPGYPLLVTASSFLVGPTPYAGLLVSVVAGALVPVATALLAHELLAGPRARDDARIPSPRTVALLAGGLVGVTGLLWQSSVAVMSDTAGLAAITLGAWALARYARTDGRRWVLLAAGLVALAISVRLVYAIPALALAAAAAFAARGAARRRGRRYGMEILGPVIVGSIVLAPTVLPMALAAAAGQPIPFTVQFSWYRWDPANLFRSRFETIEGTLAYAWPPSLFYLALPFQPYALTPLPLLLALPGVAAVRLIRAGVPVAALIAWPLATYVMLAGTPNENTRYGLPLLPPLAILLAMAIGETWRRARSRGAHLVRAAATGAALLALSAAVVGATVFTVRFVDRVMADRTAIAALANRLPPDARVLSLGPTLTLRHVHGVETIELFDLPEERALALAADPRPSFVMVDERSLATQWAGRTPAVTVAALGAGPGLDPVAHAGVYTLFRVGTGEPAGRNDYGPIMAPTLSVEAVR